MKKCAICKEQFTPISSLSKTCSIPCAIRQAKYDAEKKKAKQQKDFNKETLLMREKMNDKDKSYWADKAQKQFNAWIRHRDAMKPCISCQTTNSVKYDAGHFIPVGRSAALRFNEFNVHKQCSNYCNVHLSGNLIAYRSALVEIYGIDKVIWLEGSHEMPRYRIEDYKEIYKKYKEKMKE